MESWNDDVDLLARELPALHANLFHTLSHEQFDRTVADLRDRLPALARHQVVVEVMRLAAAIGDGHTCVSPWREPAGFHTLPIGLYRFAQGYHVRAAASDQADLLGARVTHVGGTPIEAAEKLVAPLIGRDNEMGVLMYAPLLLVMPEVLHAVGLADGPEQAELAVEHEGGSRTVSLDSAGLFPLLSPDSPADTLWGARDGWVDLREGTPLWLTRLTETYWFDPSDELTYCRLDAVQEREEPLEAFFTRACADSRRFVLDLRHNNGGNGNLNPRIVRPLLKAGLDEPGRLFVITGRRTFSAAQMLINELERWLSPVFVGEPSSSRDNHYGDSAQLALPGLEITVRVSTRWWQFWDDQQDRPWIEVDLPAPLTVEAYRTGRDPALEAVYP
jgi:hypothetical protein